MGGQPRTLRLPGFGGSGDVQKDPSPPWKLRAGPDARSGPSVGERWPLVSSPPMKRPYPQTAQTKPGGRGCLRRREGKPDIHPEIHLLVTTVYTVVPPRRGRLAWGIS